MNLPPVYELLRQRGIAFVANSDGTFWTNCPACKRPTSNFVELGGDGLSARFRCDCGSSGVERVRSAWAKPSGNVTPPGDGADLRAFEEARGEFPEEDEPEPAPEPEPECEPKPVGDGSFSHIWRSKDYDYPCTPTGEVQPDDA